MISIINYGLGNLGSIQNMFKKIGFDSVIINNPLDLEKSTKIILPGVGSFDTGMKNLFDGGWIDKLNEMVLVQKKPVLGICLGMQLMCQSSEEGELEGLKWIDADVKKFKFNNNELKVPHMGWNFCNSVKDTMLLKDDLINRRFYFVHSYYVCNNLREDVLLETSYGITFTSSFERNNIIGMQFHPEKSHKFGLNILKNFANNY
jgi:glutamine amidotransferase